LRNLAILVSENKQCSPDQSPARRQNSHLGKSKRNTRQIRETAVVGNFNYLTQILGEHGAARSTLMAAVAACLCFPASHLTKTECRHWWRE